VSKHRLIELGLDSWDDPKYLLECMEPEKCRRLFDEDGNDIGSSEECWTRPWIENTNPYEWLHGSLEGDSPWIVNAWFNGDGLVVEPIPTIVPIEIVVDGYVLRESALWRVCGSATDCPHPKGSDLCGIQWDVRNHRGETYGWVQRSPDFWLDDGDYSSWEYHTLGQANGGFASSRDKAARAVVDAARDAAEAILTGSFFEQGGDV